MSEAGSRKARVAALVRHGIAPEVIQQERLRLAAIHICDLIDTRRVALGLHPLSEEVAAILIAAAFPEANLLAEVPHSIPSAASRQKRLAYQREYQRKLRAKRKAAAQEAV